MEWLAGAALLPLIMCGVMCVGGIALAALGFRRTQDGAAPTAPCCSNDTAESDATTNDDQQHHVEA